VDRVSEVGWRDGTRALIICSKTTSAFWTFSQTLAFLFFQRFGVEILLTRFLFRFLRNTKGITSIEVWKRWLVPIDFGVVDPVPPEWCNLTHLQESGHRLQPTQRTWQGQGLLRCSSRVSGATRFQWRVDLGQRGSIIDSGWVVKAEVKLLKGWSWKAIFLNEFHPNSWRCELFKGSERVERWRYVWKFEDWVTWEVSTGDFVVAIPYDISDVHGYRHSSQSQLVASWFIEGPFILLASCAGY